MRTSRRTREGLSGSQSRPRAAILALSERNSRSTPRTPNLLGGVRLERAPRRYTRNFLFGDCSMSAWVMVWAPGSATSIHDHHCSCCFAVLRGSLREIWFKPDGEECAVKTAEALRAPGYIACMLPSGPNIHQMTNDGPEEAISIISMASTTGGMPRQLRASIGLPRGDSRKNLRALAWIAADLRTGRSRRLRARRFSRSSQRGKAGSLIRAERRV